MRFWSRLLYLGCFIALAAVATVGLDHALSPTMAPVLLSSVLAAILCATPGLAWRRLWPLSLALLPLCSYLLMRSIVPLPATVEGLGGQFHFYTAQLQAGASSYKGAPYPLQVAHDPGLQLFLGFCTYWAVGVGAFLALSLRRPVSALVPLLVLFGYGLTVDTSLRMVLPAVLFAFLSALLLVLCGAVTRKGWRLRDGVAGAALGLAASLLSVALLLAAPSVAAEPWQDWRRWDPFDVRGAANTFDWLKNYPTLLDPGQDLPVMRVESSRPSYWRASVLDSFTGSAWVTSQAFSLHLDATEGSDGLYTYVLPDTELMPRGQTVTQSFHMEPTVQTNYFFTGGDPRSLALEQDLAVRTNNTRTLRAPTPMRAGLSYSLTGVIPELAPTDLVGLGTEYPDGLDQYAALPFPRLEDSDGTGPRSEAAWQDRLSERAPDGWEWQQLYSLNRTILAEATDPYQITLRIERYLRRFYAYTLAPPASRYSSPYAAFLFDTRSGYCQHFAGAMALLLRFNGIPSRVAVGFDLGEPDGAGAYLVSTNDAHAWVQAFFPDVGWVDFDPTPGRNVPIPGGSSTSRNFRYPFVDSNEPSWTETDATDPAASSRPPAEEAPAGAFVEQERGGPGVAAWLPWVLVAATLVLGWPSLRALWRRRSLHRGPPRERLQASLHLLCADLVDRGVPVTSAHTLGEALQLLRARTGIESDLTLIDRAEAVLFGARGATAADVQRAEAFRRSLKKRLRKHYGWVRTCSAWYSLPRFGGA
jgi:transglutaminase-like putative cysteine protease